MFINLSREERKEIIEATAQRMHVDPVIIEKDWWVVQTLSALFSSPFANQLTFKGGTSLSKAYQLIERFSEDIDITINKHSLVSDFDVEKFETLSNNKKNKALEDLDSKANAFIINEILPHLKNNMPFAPLFKISENDPLALEIHYESLLSSKLDYIQSHIYVEFGVRGSITPAEQKPVQSYIQNIFGSSVDSTAAFVNTLCPIKTFFEKATLLHAEYNRHLDKPTPQRLSRHYYDLFQMRECGFLQEALSYEVLDEVIRHKNNFFQSSWAKYSSILESGIKMIPHKDRINTLQEDYKATAIMIFKIAPDFDEILSSIAMMEEIINLRITLENQGKTALA
jgi:hypothetical protein